MANEIDEAAIDEFLRSQGATPSVTAPAPLTAEAQRQAPSTFVPEEQELLAPGIGGRPAPAVQAAGVEAAGLPPLQPQRTVAGGVVPAGAEEAIRQALEVRKRSLVEAKQDPTDRPLTEEAQRAAANLAVTGAVGVATGGAGLIPRALAQGASALLTEFAVRRAQGDPFKEAATNALEVGGLDLALEVASPLPGKVTGLAVQGARLGFDKANRAVRRLADLPLPPERSRIESLRAPFKDRLEPGAADIIAETDRLAAKEGISAPFSPGQLSEVGIVDQIENIISQSASASASLRRKRKIPLRLNRQSLEEIVDSFPAVNSEELQVILRDIGEDRLKELTGLARGMFNTLDERLGSEAVNIGPFKEALSKRIQSHAGGILPEQFNKVKRILEMPDSITYANAQEIRANLHVLSKQFSGEAVLTAERGLAKWSAGQFKNVLTKSISELAPELAPVAKEANRLWGQEIRGELTTKYIKAMVDKSPEAVVDALVKGQQPGFTRMVRNIVMEQDPSGTAWKKIQGSWFNDLMWDATDAAASGNLARRGERVVRGSRILELAKRRANADDPNMRAFFPGKEGQAKIKRFLLNARGMAAAEREAGGQGIGSIWFTMQQAAAAGVVLGVPGDLIMNGQLTGATPATLGVATGIFIAPSVFEKLMTSATGSKWLTVGLGAPRGSRAGRRALFGLTAYLIRERLLPPEEEVKAKELLRETREAMKQDKGTRPTGQPDFSRELAGASSTAIP